MFECLVVQPDDCNVTQAISSQRSRQAQVETSRETSHPPLYTYKSHILYIYKHSNSLSRIAVIIIIIKMNNDTLN